MASYINVLSLNFNYAAKCTLDLYYKQIPETGFWKLLSSHSIRNQGRYRISPTYSHRGNHLCRSSYTWLSRVTMILCFIFPFTIYDTSDHFALFSLHHTWYIWSFCFIFLFTKHDTSDHFVLFSSSPYMIHLITLLYFPLHHTWYIWSLCCFFPLYHTWYIWSLCFIFLFTIHDTSHPFSLFSSSPYMIHLITLFYFPLHHTWYIWSLCFIFLFTIHDTSDHFALFSSSPYMIHLITLFYFPLHHTWNIWSL